MRAFQQVGCLTLCASLAWAGSACGREQEPEQLAAQATVDLLARGPDEDEGTSGVHVDLQQRRVRLEPGAHVRYRIEPRVPSRVQLAARSSGQGRLEAAWFALDLAGGAETPLASSTVVLEEAGITRSLSLPAVTELLELRLAWHAAAGSAALELHELGLHESAPVERPSIVLIVIDTLSAKHLSTYGYPLETDPELARFASESFLFEHCYTNAPWTLPSFMALMSGLYSRAHELVLWQATMWEEWCLAQNRWTLAESLRAAGYRTGGFVDTTWLTENFGVPQGFDVYDASAAQGPFGKQGNPEGGIRRTAALARRFLEGVGLQESSFLFMHALDVHGPYLAVPSALPRPLEEELYDRERTRPAGGSPQSFGIIPTYVARGEVPSGELPNPMHTAPFEKAYDTGIRFVDEELGKFFDFLRDEELLERSWVVITADHGETMADAIHILDHNVLDQDVVHVPLIIRPPGGFPGGKRIEDAVQLVDLYPTLIELAGLGEGRTHVHGRSLVPLLHGDARVPSVVLAEGGVMRQAMLIAEGWKLVKLEPAKDSTPEARISHPLLMRGFPPLAELEAKKGRRNGTLRWLDDLELRRDFFERMPATGLTDELLAQMKSRPGFKSFLAFVDRMLEGPFFELYDLTADPGARHDVAAQHPEKVAALKLLLKQEQRRRTDAWEFAKRPAKPAELAPQDIQALEALGYGGSSGDGAHEDGE